MCYTNLMPEEPHLTSVEAQAASREEQFARVVLQHDQKKMRQGFEMGKPDTNDQIRFTTVGMTGKQFEAYCLHVTAGPKLTQLHGHELPEIADDTEAITNAIHRSYFTGESKRDHRANYVDRELYFPEWLADVYHLICEELRKRGTFMEAMKKGVLMESIVKPVPCLQTQLDLHRGIDCLFVFHDPDTYTAAKKTQFAEAGPHAPANPDVREARYWNPVSDTIVSLDVTAYLGTKFGQADSSELRADVFASKTDSATNHYIRQQLEQQGAPPLPDRQEQKGGRYYWDRMQVLAERIVDAFEAKSGRTGAEKFPHLRNPEAERRARIAAIQATTQDKAASALDLRKRQKAAKEAGRAEGEARRAEVIDRTQANLDSMPPHERRIYEMRQKAKQELIERAKSGGKLKKKKDE